MKKLFTTLLMAIVALSMMAENFLPADTLLVGAFNEATKQDKNELLMAKYGGYRPKHEVGFTALPYVAFGFAVKGQKKNFRSARQNMIPSYENRFDDVLQHVPLMSMAVMKLAGYEGRSNWGRFLVSGGMSYAFMGIFANGIKYTAKEMRPDGSTANSFPSGHTATAFVAAHIMHKEYGETRSPWWSVFGYGCATTTGIMRTLNNRHWISDVLVGAGIGIISTDLGYLMADYMFKDWGIKRKRSGQGNSLITNPSFFKLSLGTASMSDIKLPEYCQFTQFQLAMPFPEGTSVWDAQYLPVKAQGDPFGDIADKPGIGRNRTIKVGTVTSVGAEAAYFINPYVGFGGRVRIMTAPVYAEGLECNVTVPLMDGQQIEIKNSGSASDVMSIVDAELGVYGSLPFNDRFALGTKLLYGRRFTGSVNLSGKSDEVMKIGEEERVVTFTGDALDLDIETTDQFSTGLSFTYAMGSGAALSLFWDFDWNKTNYNCKYWPENENPDAFMKGGREFSFKQRNYTNTIGASVTVMF